MRHSLALIALFLALAAGGCTVVEITFPEDDPIYREIDLIAADSGAIASAGTTLYTVVAGDTLFTISQRWHTSLAALVDLNPHVTNLRAMPVGTRLRVPLGGKAAPPPVEEEPSDPMDMMGEGPDPDRAVVYGKKFSAPVAGEVLAGFGEKLDGPLPRRNRGLDYVVKRHDPVRAARGGKAVVMHHMPRYGTVLLIEHDDETCSFYGHVTDLRVRTGQTVSQGEVIALAAGGRLHFRITRGGEPVDPKPLLTR